MRLAVAALLAALAAACTTGGAPAPPPAFPLRLTDDDGVEVRLERAPRRIVSLAPHLTEVLFAVGAADAVVGVSGAETHPPEARVLPSMAGPDGVAPDPAAVAAAHPDLVLAAAPADAPWKEAIRSSAPLATLRASTVGDALGDFETVGRLTGTRAATRRLAGAVRKRIGDLRAGAPGRQQGVVLEVGLSFPPAQVAGPRSLPGELVGIVGGRLLGPDGEFPEWSSDEVLRADPDVYLALRTTVPDRETIARRPGFDRLRAVQAGRVHLLSDDLVLLPGPRLAEGAAAIAAAIEAGGQP